MTATGHSARPTPTLSDSIWKMLQGANLREPERRIMARTLKALSSRQALDQIVEASQRTAVRPGQTIVKQGDEGRTLFLMLEGEAVLERGGAEVTRYKPGEFFGEMGLLDGSPRSGSISTVTRAIVLEIPPEAVDTAMRERLWAYAAQRRFQNLDELPLPSGRAAELWFEAGRHAHLRPGEYQTDCSWLFVYLGSPNVNGSPVPMPSLVPGGTLTCDQEVRVVLLPAVADFEVTQL